MTWYLAAHISWFQAYTYVLLTGQQTLLKKDIVSNRVEIIMEVLHSIEASFSHHGYAGFQTG